jgi:methanethiol oxidase
LITILVSDNETSEGETEMALWRPDPTFYPSAKMAMEAPPEKLAFVAMLNGNKNGKPDALGVVDVGPESSGYGHLVGQVDLPHPGDELHHFGWNACSACLCPYAPHPHVERRYLVVPGINSSRIHIIDTKPNPRRPEIVKVIEPETLALRAGYTSPHRYTAGRRESTSARWDQQMARDRAAFS